MAEGDPKVAVIFMLNLRGGGGDIACDRCLSEARHDHAGSVVSVARIDSPSEPCQWCGVTQGESHDALKPFGQGPITQAEIASLRQEL